MRRYLIVFARDPGREASVKGLRSGGADLFAAFTAGWRKAASRVGARVVIAAPPEDLAAWRTRLGGEADEVLWISQQGSSLGKRLERVLRQTVQFAGRSVIVGGDVPPAMHVLRAAFEALDGGADAVIAPAPDGGVSLLSLPPADADLVASLAPRQRGVAEWLRGSLSARCRSVALVSAVGDVDGRRSLRSLLRDPWMDLDLRALAVRILGATILQAPGGIDLRRRGLANPCGLRAPPAA